jgi:hypothetical protein
MTRYRQCAAILLVTVLVVGGVLAPSALPQGKSEGKATPWKLGEAKLDAARRACELIALDYRLGRASYEQFATWSRRWMEAQKESGKRSDQQTAVEAHVDRMRQLEKAAKERVAAKQAPASEEPATEYLRIEAELLLSRTRGNK